MKFYVAKFDYDTNRDGNPYLFQVIGEPEGETEWKQFGGRTQETMTATELEAKGITLPSVLAGTTAETTKRVDALQAELAAERLRGDNAVKASSDETKRADSAEAALVALRAAIARLVV